jgi:hypothetical protein
MRTHSNSPVENPEPEAEREGEVVAVPETPIPPQSQLQNIPSLNTSRVDSKEHELKGLGLGEEGEEKKTDAMDRKEGSDERDEGAEGGDGDEASVARVMGTHRFSVLNKDLLELHGNDSKKKDQGVSKACKYTSFILT